MPEYLICQVKNDRKVVTDHAMVGNQQIECGYMIQILVGKWHLSTPPEGEYLQFTGKTKCGQQLEWGDKLFYRIVKYDNIGMMTMVDGTDIRNPKFRKIKNDELCSECFTLCGSPKL